MNDASERMAKANVKPVVSLLVCPSASSRNVIVSCARFRGRGFAYSSNNGASRVQQGSQGWIRRDGHITSIAASVVSTLRPNVTTRTCTGICLLIIHIKCIVCPCMLLVPGSVLGLSQLQCTSTRVQLYPDYEQYFRLSITSSTQYYYYR